MARMARTQTDLMTGNGGMPTVKVGKMGHVVPQQVGASSGVNPFAGDLTSAFDNFFGKLQNTLQSTQEADFAIQKMEAQKSAEMAAKQGAAAAATAVNKGATLSDRDSSMAALDPAMNPQKDRQSFVDAYRDSFGSNLGNRLFGDFVTSQADQSPANFEANAEAFYNEQIGKGTGDVRIDTSMQAAWARSFEPARINAKIETIKAAKAASLSAFKDEAVHRTRDINFGWTDIDSATATTQSIYPNMSLGQASAFALATMRDAAVANGPNATMRFLAQLDRKRVETDVGGSYDVAGTSLSEKFPAAVEEIRRSTYDKLQQDITIGGASKLTASSSKLAAFESDFPDEFDRFNAVANFLTKDINELGNTPGVNFQQLTALRTKAVEQLTELGEYRLGMNTLKGFGLTGERPSHMDADYVKKYLPEFMGRYANLMQDASNGETDAAMAQRAGAMLKRVTDQFGDGIMSPELRAHVAAPLLSDDPKVQLRGRNALMSMDPTGNRARALLSDNPRAAEVFEGLANSKASVGGVVSANTPEMQAARELVKKQGGVESMLFADEKTKDARTIKFNEEFFGSAMGEALEEALGVDGSWFNPFSWGTQNMTPEVQLALEGHVRETVVRMTKDGEDLSLSEIRKSVANKMASSVVSVGGKLQLITTYNGTNLDQGVAAEAMPTPIGNAVHNQNTGTYENTAETLTEDVQSISEGFTGLALDEKLTVEKNADLVGNNLYGVMKEDGLPLVLGVGLEMNVNKQYSKNGQEIGALSKWWAGDEKISFTGDLEHDSMLASEIMHPSLTLIPMRDSSGAIREYRVAVGPRLKDFGSMPLEKLRELAKENQSPDLARAIAKKELWERILNQPMP